MRHVAIISTLATTVTVVTFGAERTLGGDGVAAERGWVTLTNRTFSPPLATSRAYEGVWKQWGLKERPADFSRMFLDRYGLYEAPYGNGGLPMGLRKGVGFLGTGVTTDCMLCHAGRVAGQTVIGLGNSTIDFQSLIDDLMAGDIFRLPGLPTFSNVRGTIEASASVAYLMQFRDEDLNVSKAPQRFEWCDTLCEDIPAWWNLKRKSTMYLTGGANARSVRTLMSFMLSPTQSGDYIKKHVPEFTDIQAFLLSLEAPKYPFEVDTERAARGAQVFRDNCVRCHGTYGPDGKYPNKVVPLDVIGTDPMLSTGGGVNRAGLDHFARSWFAQERGPNGEPYVWETSGYQAPPLDGVWATAPYFHNGSAPTVYHVLNSSARPTVFTRTYRAEPEDYDPVRLGVRITELESSPDSQLSAFERRKIYDTTLPGRANTGHTFGDRLSDEERMAVIEYLKTL